MKKQKKERKKDRKEKLFKDSLTLKIICKPVAIYSHNNVQQFLYRKTVNLGIFDQKLLREHH